MEFFFLYHWSYFIFDETLPPDVVLLEVRLFEASASQANLSLPGISTIVCCHLPPAGVTQFFFTLNYTVMCVFHSGPSRESSKWALRAHLKVILFCCSLMLGDRLSKQRVKHMSRFFKSFLCQVLAKDGGA